MIFASLGHQIFPANGFCDVFVNPSAKIAHICLTKLRAIVRSVWFAHELSPKWCDYCFLLELKCNDKGEKSCSGLMVEGKSKDKKDFSMRKRPVQQRSKITIGALQEAFVRVLIDRGYENIDTRLNALGAEIIRVN